MFSIGRLAICASLAFGLLGPDGGFAQTTTQIRTSSFCYDMAIPGSNCVQNNPGAGTGILNREVVEPGGQQAGAPDPTLWQQTDYAIDAYGNRTSVTVTGFDKAGNQSITRQTTIVYDQNHQFVSRKTYALDPTHSISENFTSNAAFAKPATYTDANNVQSSWQYDTFGRKTLEIHPDGTQTKFTYVSCTGGNCPCQPGSMYAIGSYDVSSSGAQIGPDSYVHYDALDREIYRHTRIFDGSHYNEIQTQYDALGRVSQKSRPFVGGCPTPQTAPQVTTYSYDALGRVTTESLPDGHTITHAYRGLATTDTNQNGQTRTVTKNSQGQVISVKDAFKNATTFYYDPFGNLLQTVDATGKNVVVNNYDTRGRKIQSNDPDLGVWTYLYDGLGQLRQQTDAKNQSTTFKYDALGRLIERDEIDMTATWTYDGPLGVPTIPSIGKLVSATASGAAAGSGFQRSLTYDNIGRALQVTITVHGTPYTIAAGYSTSQPAYDVNGRLTGVTYPSRLHVKYNYTGLGYLQQLTDGDTNQVYWTAVARDAEFHLTQDTAGNGITTARGFDPPTGRLTSVVAGSSNAVVNFSYSYDGVGNLVTRGNGNRNVYEGFGYDALNRLIASSISTSGDPTMKFFSYNSIGNLLTKSDVGDYAYPEPGLARPHGVLSIDGDLITATFSYDANGNQTSAAGSGVSRQVTYSSYNKPASIQQGANSIGFYDDVDHQRYQQTLTQNSAVTVTNYFDGFGVHAELVTSATTQWNDYMMVGGSMVGVRFLQGTTVTLRYFHQDHLGSIAVITDQNGIVAEPDAYDPWGKRRFLNGNDDTTGSITSLTSRGFTGQEMLDSVTLVHLNGRVYDPNIGRMLSADPVVGDPLNGQSWNRYSYVYNNPLAYTDPTGYCAGNCIPTVTPPPSQNWFARHSLFGDILRIAVAAVCVAVGPSCAPFAPVFAFVGSAAVAGLNGGNFVDAMHSGTLAFMQAMLMNGVGNLTQHTPAFGTVPHFENVIGHALVGCLMASAGGGTCGSGAAAGAVPAFAGPVINGEGFSLRALVLNTTLGGLASVAGGGKFGNGAVTGAFGYLFNQLYIFARPTPVPFEALGEAIKPLEETVKPAEEVVEPKGGCYVLCNSEGDVVKSGRSNDLARREGELARDRRYEDFDFQEMYRTDEYAVQRGLEKTLYDTFKPPLDQIRPISPQNPNAGRYMEAAKRFLETNQ